MNDPDHMWGCKTAVTNYCSRCACWCHRGYEDPPDPEKTLFGCAEREAS